MKKPMWKNLYIWVVGFILFCFIVASFIPDKIKPEPSMTVQPTETDQTIINPTDNQSNSSINVSTNKSIPLNRAIKMVCNQNR